MARQGKLWILSGEWHPEGEIPLTNGAYVSGEQVVELVCFLVSDRANHITGTEIWIDGGQSLLQG